VLYRPSPPRRRRAPQKGERQQEQPLRRIHNLDDVAADVPADQVGRLPRDQQASLIDDDQPVAEAGGLVHVVGRKQNGSNRLTNPSCMIFTDAVEEAAGNR